MRSFGNPAVAGGTPALRSIWAPRPLAKAARPRNMKRIVEPELLDTLSPGDPRAAGSRRDLRRLNAWMRNHAIMANALQTAVNGRALGPIV